MRAIPLPDGKRRVPAPTPDDMYSFYGEEDVVPDHPREGDMRRTDGVLYSFWQNKWRTMYPKSNSKTPYVDKLIESSYG